MDTPPFDDLQAWVGRSQTLHDTLHPTPAAALAATLDHPPQAWPPGTPLPPLWHWLYFLPQHRASEIGPDGHARRGGFLPPVPLPRRMWAGSQFSFHAPLRIGDAVTRRSTIAEVTPKQGRSGALVFVKVKHEVSVQGAATPALTEFHDIVYREARRPGEAEPPPQPAPTGAPWQRGLVPDDVLLFRYSALTFNGHRIHYDRRYVTGIEGYPGLVVHGPLIATLLLDLLRRELPQAEVAAFRFRALRPTFDGAEMRVSAARDGDTVRLWAQDHAGWLTMDATAVLKPAGAEAMQPAAGGVAPSVLIVEHRHAWAAEHEALAQALRAALGPLALRVDAIGSTAVPGLCAKDVLDVQVAVATLQGEAAAAIVQRLQAAGFVLHAGATADHVPPGADADPAAWRKLLFKNPPGQRRAHIHVRVLGAANQRYALLCRDALRAQPALAQAYGELKRRLAATLARADDYPVVKDPAVDLVHLAAEAWAACSGWRNPGAESPR